MRTLLSLIPLLLVGCGPKAPPAPPVEPAAAAPVVEAPPQPEAAAEAPKPPPPPPVNADLKVNIAKADGTRKVGHVKRVERSTDWFGEADWSLSADDLKIVAEAAGKEAKLTWKDIKSVTVVPGKPAEDVDCSYDSNYNPWMYDCTLKTTAKLTGADGKVYEVTNRNKWRFTFDDDSQIEFWLYKYPVRQQDEQRADVTDDIVENPKLYEDLQARIRVEMKTMVTSVTITP